MALKSYSSPTDLSFGAMATPAPVSIMTKSKIKNKGDRYRVSDTGGNVSAKKKAVKAGGVGSGRKKEVEQYLKSQGFEQHKVYGTQNGDNPNGGSHWHKSYDTNIHGTQISTGVVTHGVMVNSDGTWVHTVTGNHHGSAGDISHLHLSANSDGISGTTLDSLKRIVARAFKESSRKNLAKKGDALKDGSFPIANKSDLGNAKQAIGRSKHPAAARRLINKRAKQLGAPKLGASKFKARNESSIEYYSNGKKKLRASISVTCSTGKLTIHAGGPGSGRHITVTTGNNKERIAMHKSLTNKGYNMAVKFGQNGDRTHTYSHPNGDKVTMHYVPGRTTSPAYDKGKNAGAKLGGMLRDALQQRMSKAIQISK